MNYYNQPNQLMQQIFGGAPTQSPMRPNISEDQFLSFMSTLDKNSLQKLVFQARQRGISETDIKAGLDILLRR